MPEQKQTIQVIADFYLKPPFLESFNKLLDVSNFHGMNIVRGDTNSVKTLVAVPAKLFKKLWGTNPQEGTYQPCKGLEGFIVKIVVKEIKVENN